MTWTLNCGLFFNRFIITVVTLIAGIAGLMGRNRGHWPEFQIRPDMSSREVLMVYKCIQNDIRIILVPNVLLLVNLF